MIKITKRKLRSEEILLLIKNIKSFPDLTYVSQKRWQSFKNCYVACQNQQFAGVCVIYDLGSWLKIGPGFKKTARARNW
ncbi:hypothetical protein ACFLZP_03945 [Patescibacteria group bacterium]